MRLSGRTILITGASKGIGEAAARLFASDGAELVLVARSEGSLKKLSEELAALGARAAYICADVTKESDCNRAVDFALTQYGKLDGLFNNAGSCLESDAGLLDTSIETWQSSLTLNLTSIFLMCKAAVPHLAKCADAAILNNAAMVAHIGSAHAQIAYCAAKGGVVSMTRELAIELAPLQIRVNAVSPGPIATELYGAIQQRYPDFLETRMPHLPMKRFGMPKEIASVAAFLLSSESAYITGQIILADGGITSAYTTKPIARI